LKYESAYLRDIPVSKQLERLKYLSAQNFYAMYLDWRIRSASYGEMIATVLRYRIFLILDFFLYALNHPNSDKPPSTF